MEQRILKKKEGGKARGVVVFSLYTISIRLSVDREKFLIVSRFLGYESFTKES